MKQNNQKQDKITVGKKIRNLRKVNKISQEDLAEDLGITRQTISKWERDIIAPNSCSISCLCTYFKVDSAYFIENESYDKLSSVSANNEVLSKTAISADSPSNSLIIRGSTEAITKNVTPVIAYNAVGYVSDGFIVETGSSMAEYNGLKAEYEIAPVKEKSLKEKIISTLKFLVKWVLMTGLVLGSLLLFIYIYTYNYPDYGDDSADSSSTDWGMMVLFCMAVALVVMFIIFIVKKIRRKIRLKKALNNKM